MLILGINTRTLSLLHANGHNDIFAGPNSNLQPILELDLLPQTYGLPSIDQIASDMENRLFSIRMLRRIGSGARAYIPAFRALVDIPYYCERNVSVK